MPEAEPPAPRQRRRWHRHLRRGRRLGIEGAAGGSDGTSTARRATATAGRSLALDGLGEGRSGRTAVTDWLGAKHRTSHQTVAEIPADDDDAWFAPKVTRGSGRAGRRRVPRGRPPR
jgi:hypothetical protein